MAPKLTPRRQTEILARYRELKGKPENTDTNFIFGQMAKEFRVKWATIPKAIERAKKNEETTALARNVYMVNAGLPIDYSVWGGKVFEIINGVIFKGEDIKVSTQRMVELLLSKMDKQNKPPKDNGDESPKGFDQDDEDSPV